MTLAVLCKKRHSGEEYDVTKHDDDHCDEDYVDQTAESSYHSKHEVSNYSDNVVTDNNTPDVLQAVKLWYV